MYGGWGKALQSQTASQNKIGGQGKVYTMDFHRGGRLSHLEKAGFRQINVDEIIWYLGKVGTWELNLSRGAKIAVTRECGTNLPSKCINLLQSHSFAPHHLFDPSIASPNSDSLDKASRSSQLSGCFARETLIQLRYPAACAEFRSFAES